MVTTCLFFHDFFSQASQQGQQVHLQLPQRCHTQDHLRKSTHYGWVSLLIWYCKTVTLVPQMNG